jgi:hypothetical protein
MEIFKKKNIKLILNNILTSCLIDQYFPILDQGALRYALSEDRIFGPGNQFFYHRELNPNSEAKGVHIRDLVV